MKWFGRLKWGDQYIISVVVVILIGDFVVLNAEFIALLIGVMLILDKLQELKRELPQVRTKIDPPKSTEVG